MNDTHRETEKGRRNPDRLAAYKDGGEWKLLKLVFNAQSTMTAINRAKDVGKVEKVGGGGRGDGGGGGGGGTKHTLTQLIKTQEEITQLVSRRCWRQNRM